MRAMEGYNRNDNDSRFTLSYPPSVSSSRSASPAPDDHYAFIKSETNDKAREKEDSVEDMIPGRLPVTFYESTLPWWRAAVRRVLVNMVLWESNIIAKMQVSCVFQSTTTEGE